MPEWESWRNNSSYNSTSDTGEHRANCSDNHLARVRTDCYLTYQDVERENRSRSNNQISTDYCGDAAKSEKKSVRHEATLHGFVPHVIASVDVDLTQLANYCGASCFMFVWKMASH